jgi:hypothetical protein
MFVVAAFTFAAISAAVCLAGFAFPMMKVEASPSSDLMSQILRSAEHVKQAKARNTADIRVRQVISGQACPHFKWLATGFRQALP